MRLPKPTFIFGQVPMLKLDLSLRGVAQNTQNCKHLTAACHLQGKQKFSPFLFISHSLK